MLLMLLMLRDDLLARPPMGQLGVSGPIVRSDELIR